MYRVYFVDPISGVRCGRLRGKFTRAEVIDLREYAYASPFSCVILEAVEVSERTERPGVFLVDPHSDVLLRCNGVARSWLTTLDCSLVGVQGVDLYHDLMELYRVDSILAAGSLSQFATELRHLETGVSVAVTCRPRLLRDGKSLVLAWRVEDSREVGVAAFLGRSRR